MVQIPKLFQKFFWDYDINDINHIAHKQFIIERLLEKGTISAIKWIKQNYTSNDIIYIVNHSPNLSAQTKNFWNSITQYL